MFDRTQQPLLIARLRMVLTVLERIPTRFASIQQPSDFVSSDAGLERMDSICMVLIAVSKFQKRITETMTLVKLVQFASRSGLY